MMKKIRNLLMVVVLITLVASITAGCGDSKKELKAQIEKLQEENERLDYVRNQNEKLQEENEELKNKNQEIQTQLDQSNSQLNQVKGDSATKYLTSKFYQDGKIYKATNREITFYSDTACQQEITEEVKILSPVVDHPKWKNEIDVYAVYSNFGYIYSVKRPSLNGEETK